MDLIPVIQLRSGICWSVRVGVATRRSFKSTQAWALRVYLRRAVDNRIRDEMRRATFRQGVILPEGSVRASDASNPQLRRLIDDETWRRYVDAVKRLPDRDRRLVVVRAELGYNSAQLAFLERLSSPAVARVGELLPLPCHVRTAAHAPGLPGTPASARHAAGVRLGGSRKPGGTLRYMSPEVIAGCPAEEADDVWSLGVVLREMVSGRHPFADGGSAADVQDRIGRQRLAAGDSLPVGAGLPSAVLALTASLLTARRPARPTTAQAFIGALEAMVAAQR